MKSDSLAHVLIWPAAETKDPGRNPQADDSALCIGGTFSMSGANYKSIVTVHFVSPSAPALSHRVWRRPDKNMGSGAILTDMQMTRAQVA